MLNLKEYPLITIISINYNSEIITCELLESLSRITYPRYETIIVDNASYSDEYKIIGREYPHVKLIRSEENLGFAGGNNLGVKEAKGEYILFLNNDTEVEPGFLEPLVQAFQNDADLGLVSPKIRFFFSDNKQTIQYAGGEAINSFTGRGRYIGSGEIDNGQYHESQYTELIHGAAVLVPMFVLEKAGLMPDIYFLYYEELDWCENIKRHGYKLKYVANSVVYHKESMSVGKNSKLKSYYMSRNRIIFLRRNTNYVRQFISIIFVAFFSLPKTLILHLLRKEFLLLMESFRGALWNLFNYKDINQTPQLLTDIEGNKHVVNTYNK